MHNNYYFLKRLTEKLKPKLIGFRLATCFSQNKNELILGFTNSREEFYIKAHLDPSFCCLYFPENFQRARKNSVNIFDELLDQQVVDLKQFLNERCFSLILSNGQRLLFKMQGNRSNIILCSADGSVMKLFNSKLKNDWNIDINTLDRPIDQSHTTFLKNNGDIKMLFPTFGKVINNYLKQQEYDQMPIEKQWSVIDQLLQKLDDPEYYIVESNGTLIFSLLPIDDIKDQFEEPVSAINSFFVQYVSTESIQRLKKQALTQIDKVISQSKSYLKKTRQKLEGLNQATDYSRQADILMANLHQINTGKPTVTLQNFYDNNAPITINLKKHLSPQKNAEAFYRKAKNQAKEFENLKDNLTSKEQLISTYKKFRSEVTFMDDFKTLKNYLKDHGILHGEGSKSTVPYPYSQFNYGGFVVWVGKNAKSNDKMLQAHAFKEDLWLHARDVSGSHVIIKYQAGKNFPKAVIEFAAQLAAYHSKRKTDTLCPVIVTPRKYVRKRKGDPSGAVVVDQEDVIMVAPKKPVP